MCSPTLFLGASAGVSALGSIAGGNAANSQAKYQASQQDYQANVEQDNALAQAQVIRKSAREARASATAGYAGSGVVVGEGSAQEVDRAILNDSEHDAFTAILNGNRRARGLRQDAEVTRAAGKNAQKAGLFNGLGTALSAGYKIGSGWKTAPADTGTYGGRRSE